MEIRSQRPSVGTDWKAKSTGNIVRIDDRYQHATTRYVIVHVKYLKTGRTRLYRLSEFLRRFESMAPDDIPGGAVNG